MNIVIYTKSGCPNCTTAKALLKSKGQEYLEWEVETDVERQMFSSLYHSARQLPYIIIDGQPVGGLAGLQAALKQVGL